MLGKADTSRGREDDSDKNADPFAPRFETLRLILDRADLPRAKRGPAPVSDRGTLRGLTQFATQFGFAGSATSL